MLEREFYEQPTLPHHLPEGDKIPEIIGPYKIESLLNKGGMSLLYLGVSPTNKPLVVKVLSPNFVSHPEMVDQFLEEAKIIGMTDHPNIVKLYGQGEWEKGLYIAMEFIQGISLRQFIVQHSLSLKRSLDIILQVAYALLHLHTHGVVHRDVKPENILITEDGQVKVIDFGIAQLTLDQDKMLSGKGGFIGTPSYMSPEQKKDPLSASFVSDIFSLGIILYELVIGKLSFGSIQLSLLPKKIRPIIEKAIQPNIAKRYADIVDLISDISGYLKSATYEQERSGEDEIKEMRETLQQTHNGLLPKVPSNWSDMDIGAAKTTNYPDLGIYYDFYHLDDKSYLIYLVQTEQNHVSDLINIAIFKGIIEEKRRHSSTVNVRELAFNLNEIYSAKKMKRKLAVNILHLDPSHNVFSFVSCGMGSIWHYVMENNTYQLLINRNPPLGDALGHDFYPVTDQWKDGDILLAHTFHSFHEDSLSTESLDQDIEQAFTKFVHLSSANLADHVLKKIHGQYFSTKERSYAVLSLQRIV